MKRFVIGRHRSLPRPWIRFHAKIPDGYRDLHSARSGLQLIKRPAAASDASGGEGAFLWFEENQGKRGR